MLFYRLKFRKNTEGKNPKVAKTKSRKKSFHQTVGFVAIKNQDLLKNKKQKGF